MAGSRSPARRWLTKAQQDLAAAERVISPPPLPAVACFHAHQAAEKSLKAVAAHLGAQEIPRTHSLLESAQLIRDVGGSTPFSDEQLASLDPYAVQARYPDFPEPSGHAAGQAVELAREICAWAQRIISSE